jgi:hypothetical protein
METWKQNAKLLKEINDAVKEFDESIRLEAFKFLLAQASPQVPSPALPHLPAQGSKKVPAAAFGERGLAPQELLRKCGVSSLTDKAQVLAYWFEIFQAHPAFRSSDVKAAFIQAREPAPANPSDVLARLEVAGKIMKADSEGKIQSYKLTGTGVQEVEKWLAEKPEDK